jgi:hypothetical protein
MGCPKKVKLNDDLVFGICCHDPDTGVLTDADSAPTYRVYKEEGVTPILGGAMAKLDDANTVGFYTAKIACTQRNGFQVGKTITIYIEATVDSDTGGICYGLNVKTAPWQNVIIEGIDINSGMFHHIIGRWRPR